MSRRVIKKIRFYFSVSALYALTLFFAVQGLGISFFPNAANTPVAQAQSSMPAPALPQIKIISDRPNRIVIPRLGVDLAVSDGDYDPVKKAWTLSDNHAHYAVPSTMPNDFTGNSLIYGHNYGWVFGGLDELKPGDAMQLFGAKGRVFTYIYENTQKLSPTDNTVFRFDGKPSVTLQTCSGRWNESRQMYNFRLEKAV